MTSNAKAEGRFGKQDFRFAIEEDVYICPAGEHLVIVTQLKNTEWPYADTGSSLSKLSDQTRMHHWQRSDGSHDGSMNTSLKPCNDGSTSIRRRCVSGGKRSNIPSAPSRPGWEPHILMRGAVASEMALPFGLQSDPGDEHHRHPAADSGDPSIVKAGKQFGSLFRLSRPLGQSFLTRPRPISDIGSALRHF